MSINQDTKLPPDLDFFKYAQGGRAKRKAGDTDPTTSSAPPRSDAQRKRRKVGDETEILDNNDVDDESESDASRARVRVTAKGSDVPPPIDVFNDLNRYKIAHRLLSNLRDNQYKYPTGVQAHGIPILLEVCSRPTSSHFLHLSLQPQ